MGEFVEYTFGDLDPDDYEARKEYRIPLAELRIGGNYTMVYRSQIIGGQQYYSTYPVQVADIRKLEKGASVELVHRLRRHNNWPEGPEPLFINNEGLITEEKPQDEPYDYGYLVDTDN